MAKTFCVVKKNAIALVGIPTYFPRSTEKEVIGWNAGRLYGKIQLSHLFANWKQGKFSRNSKSYILMSNELSLCFVLQILMLTAKFKILQCLVLLLVVLLLVTSFYNFQYTRMLFLILQRRSTKMRQLNSKRIITNLFIFYKNHKTFSRVIKTYLFI